MRIGTTNFPIKPAMWKLLFSSLFLCSMTILHGQQTYDKFAKDTIVTVSGFPNKIYLLGGKKLSLPVMEWFMDDYPAAHDQIRVAIFGDQLSLASYTIGGVFCLSGLLIHPQNPGLGNDLLKIGGIGLGGGVISQIWSARIQRKAVNIYNKEIRQYYARQSVGASLSLHSGQVLVIVDF